MFLSFARNRNLLALSAAVLLLAGCGKGAKPQVENPDKPPVADTPAAKGSADSDLEQMMKFLPGHCSFVVSIKVDEALESEAMREAKKQLPDFDKAIGAAKKEIGIADTDVARVLVGGPLGHEDPLFVFMTKKAITAKEMLENIKPTAQKEEKVGGYTLVQYSTRKSPKLAKGKGKEEEADPPLQHAFCVVNDKIVVVGRIVNRWESGRYEISRHPVRDVLQRDKKPDWSAGLQSALKQTDFSKTIAVALNVKDASDKDKKDMPPDVQKAVEQAEGVVLHVSLKGDTAIDLKVICKDAKGAEEVKKAATDGLAQAKEALPPALKPLLDALKLDSKDATVSASLQIQPEQVAKTIQAFAEPEKPKPGRADVLSNLRIIGLAIITHDANDMQLPSNICDKNGKPLLSWRVAILPYIEQQELYKQFKLDEPWDSEHNIKLLARMPKIYAIPGGEVGKTHFRTFTGPGTVFSGPGGKAKYNVANIPDGTTNTICVVEAADGVPWTKPDDLVLTPDALLPKLGKSRPNEFAVLLFDGSVRWLKKSIPEKTLRNAITPDDGNFLDW